MKILSIVDNKLFCTHDDYIKWFYKNFNTLMGMDLVGHCTLPGQENIFVISDKYVREYGY
jgi:hypothetical protein